jgi:type IV pilus assembly protein PilB
MKKRLGDILLTRGVVDSLQLQSALAFQRQWGLPLGQVMVDQGFAPAEQVFSALQEQTGIPSVDLDAQPLDARLARLVPLKVAESYRVVPLRLEGKRDTTLVVAIAAPASLEALDVVKSVSGKARVVPRLAPDSAIRRAIGRLYRGEVQQQQQQFPWPEERDTVELPDADDVMQFMANCMIEDVVIDHELISDDEVPQAPVMEQDGIPLLSPLELEPMPSQLVPVVTAVLGTLEQPEPSVEEARVLVYGWGADATAGLVSVLKQAGIAAREANDFEVLLAGGDFVVVSPLPSMEELGRRVEARVLVAGHAPEQEFKRAQSVGALGFLAAPVDPELLVRAVRRLLRLGNDPFSRAA